MTFKNLLPPAIALWQPSIGDRVMVVKGRDVREIALAGRIGSVVKNRGFGLFKLELEDDKQFVTVRSTMLTKVSKEAK